MDLPEAVLRAIGRLEEAGYEAVAVGGCVRDDLMGRVPQDYDLATSATPDEVMQALAGERIVPTGLPHGTVTLVLSGMAIEITTYRVDGAYLDHRRPEGVRFTGSLIEDLKRRDFTVNAIAYSPSRGLIDPMGGRRDIEGRLIRAVGDPEARFTEDALRILRALRFASRLGFEIEPETARALTKLKHSLAFVARERVGAEILGFLMGAGAASVAQAHRDVLEAALPELKAISEADWARSLGLLSRAPKEAAARLAALLSPLGAGAQPALDSLRLPGKTTERSMKLIDWLSRAPGANQALYAAQALGVLGPEDARALFRMLGADGAALEGLIESDACVTVRQLAVDGRDLTALGLKGPQVGEALRWLLGRVIAGARNERQALLDEISKNL
jgi:tRNA nucleotidyltransferase (CCA-adding enzyme)